MTFTNWILVGVGFFAILGAIGAFIDRLPPFTHRATRPDCGRFAGDEARRRVDGRGAGRSRWRSPSPSR